MAETLTVELSPGDLAYLIRLVRYDHRKLTSRYNSAKQVALRQALAQAGRRDAAILQIQRNDDLRARLEAVAQAVPHA